MATASVITLSFLLSVAYSAPVRVTETLLQDGTLLIPLPSPGLTVVFRNASVPRPSDETLMRNGTVVNSRVELNAARSHLALVRVREEDEGVYIVRDPKNPRDDRTIQLIVRDCFMERAVKYGDDYDIPVSGITQPFNLEFKPSALEANQTSRAALVLLSHAKTVTGGRKGRIRFDEQRITLARVTGADEGSYGVRDASGNIKKKECLNVKDHQLFENVPYGKTLKINLLVNSSSVHLYYTRNNDPTPHLLLDKGQFTSAQEELGFGDRLSLDGPWVYLDQVKAADSGVFKITDSEGFSVSFVHLQVQPYKLESLYVAIIALLGVLAFLLLVCLLSCLIKVKKRAKRAAALEKLAQNAGREDEGEAFRQVVKNITKLNEDSKHSQADNTEKSQSTEVDIKGLEVSSKEVGVGNLETSDSGVGFNTALPLDTDTDAPDQIPDSEAVSISIAPETKPSPPSAAESKPSPSPAMDIKPSLEVEKKASPAPETKKPSPQPLEVKLDVPEPEPVKLSPAPTPEPKAGLSPADPKPALSPSPEPKPVTSKATTPTPESVKASATPEPPKPPTPHPITNGTAEPGLDPKSSPDHAHIIEGSAQKDVHPKTPEMELKSSGAVVEATGDSAVAEDSTTSA
ncbi:uncharacterized protein si:dkeyp-77h1.4 isoform X2 [Betta splendens]|nr:uncharacterized protein si:dkeyp-77h1.4 isoform X2 [Betta splendens]XP_028984808.1 uncharacterized protein si:dkeyp-77h1.4 isoform X2 [Betta splendens]XP_028984809.1 uncharacterized protein si:dkeyp-77h1.4 isoform X2 [Betta splendens]